jgi:hypothetical protein
MVSFEQLECTALTETRFGEPFPSTRLWQLACERGLPRIRSTRHALGFQCQWIKPSEKTIDGAEKSGFSLYYRALLRTSEKRADSSFSPKCQCLYNRPRVFKLGETHPGMVKSIRTDHRQPGGNQGSTWLMCLIDLLNTSHQFDRPFSSI